MKLPCGREKTERPGLKNDELEVYREKLKDFIQKSGLKYTEQRWQIAEVILTRGGHHEAQKIVELVEKKYPNIGAATVYRSLKTLCDAGLLVESHRNENGLQYYEAAPSEHHDHIVCLDCKEIFEFNNHKIEELQESSAKELDFEASHHTHIIYARCKLLKK